MSTLPSSTSQLCKWEHLDNVGDVYTPRTGHAVVNEDGVFYLFGGNDGSAWQSDVHAYNVETNLWQEIQARGRPPPARSGAQAVVWNGAVWFFGGIQDGDYFNDVYKYDIATSMWGSVHTLGEAPQKRTDHSVVIFRDSMLVFGGFDGHNRFNDLRELHLRERRWTQVSAGRTSQVPRSRFGHTAVVYGHSMYIFGGWDGHDTLQELVEYNISSNMWIGLPPHGTAPRARYRHTAVVCGDAMFTFGGVDKTQYRFPDLHEYNFTGRQWSKVSTTSVQPSARTFHKTVVHEGFMYILGGFDGRRLNDIYRVLLRTKTELQRARGRMGEGGSDSHAMLGDALPGVPGSSGAVGDASDLQGAHMPEDLWWWSRVAAQHGQTLGLESLPQRNVEEALALSGQAIEGQAVRVQPSQAEKNRAAQAAKAAIHYTAPRETPLRLYVGGLRAASATHRQPVPEHAAVGRRRARDAAQGRAFHGIAGDFSGERDDVSADSDSDSAGGSRSCSRNAAARLCSTCFGEDESDASSSSS